MPIPSSSEPPAASGADPRTAVIDIGSNSVRLVVYQGPARVPSILFNEKVMAGLGRDPGEDGRIAAEALARAKDALARFAVITRAMDVAAIHAVATAAVRDASNGRDLIEAAQTMGIEVRTLSGEDEALTSGRGVLSAIPEAEGIVGDLGGGSLELVRLHDGVVCERASYPLGVLRIAAIRAQGKRALSRTIEHVLHEGGWSGRGEGMPFYLVGGSWRALARLDMDQRAYPLPILHHYEMTRDTIARLAAKTDKIDRDALKAVPGISSSRIPTLGDAAVLLDALVGELGSATTIVSAYGLREGLLYTALDEERRREDPLIVATREEGRRLGRFAEHGDLLDRWIAPLFEDEPDDLARLRHVACLLADVGWAANPEFRAERGMEIALHGNWIAVDARGRALIAQALFTSLGGGPAAPASLADLATDADLARAARWGLAIRFGQRFSGGVAAPLARATLRRDEKSVRLAIPEADRAFYGETVERRHKALATAFEAESRLVLT